MILRFNASTSSWIIGRALADLNPDAVYTEYVTSQTLKIDRLKVDKQALNEALSKVKLITGPESTKLGEAAVVGFREEPAGDEFKFDEEAWREFKAWLKTKGNLVSETNDYIELMDSGGP